MGAFCDEAFFQSSVNLAITVSLPEPGVRIDAALAAGVAPL